MPSSKIPFSRWIPYLIFGFVVLLAIALILPAIEMQREKARRSTDKNNLKQLGLALHNYHDTYQTLPPGGVFGEDNTDYLGWYTSALPYIDSAPLYHWFDLDYPWTDPLNTYFYNLEMSVALNPKIPQKFTIEGKGLIHYSANVRLFHRNSSVSFDDIDGTTQTWMMINTFADWREWGSPSNWHDLDWPLEGSQGPLGWWGGGVHALFADGHVEMIAPDVNQSVLESYRSGAPEVPKADQKTIPHKTTYRERPFKRNDSGRLLPEEEDGPSILTFGDRNGRLAAFVSGILSNAISNRGFNHNDLRHLLSKDADVRVLRVGLILDDEVANILLSTTRLECLDVDLIDLSDEGIADFKKLKSLIILKGMVRPEMFEKLHEELPDLELRLKKTSELD